MCFWVSSVGFHWLVLTCTYFSGPTLRGSLVGLDLHLFLEQHCGVALVGLGLHVFLVNILRG